MSREDKLPIWTLDGVPAEAMVEWCEMLRDDNPIHRDPAAAEALGFGPRTVNPGPANLAYIFNMLMAAEPGAEIAEVEARFLGNVLSGDSVRAEGEFVDGEAGLCRARLVTLSEESAAVTAELRLREGRKG